MIGLDACGAMTAVRFGKIQRSRRFLTGSREFGDQGICESPTTTLIVGVVSLTRRRCRARRQGLRACRIVVGLVGLVGAVGGHVYHDAEEVRGIAAPEKFFDWGGGDNRRKRRENSKGNHFFQRGIKGLHIRLDSLHLLLSCPRLVWFCPAVPSPSGRCLLPRASTDPLSSRFSRYDLAAWSLQWSLAL